MTFSMVKYDRPESAAQIPTYFLTIFKKKIDLIALLACLITCLIIGSCVIVLISFIANYGVNAAEAEEPIGEYKTLNEFFYRRLKPGVRPIFKSGSSNVAVHPVSIQLPPHLFLLLFSFSFSFSYFIIYFISFLSDPSATVAFLSLNLGKQPLVCGSKAHNFPFLRYWPTHNWPNPMSLVHCSFADWHPLTIIVFIHLSKLAWENIVC